MPVRQNIGNSRATRPWAEQHEREDRALAGLATALLELAAAQPGERVLDIGCGAGTTVLALVAQVGSSGYVLGADVSDQSAARARERIATAGLRQAEVICADVATHAFAGGSFDLAFSRLGVMFFDDPTAAFVNVHRAMRPGDGRRWQCSARLGKTPDQTHRSKRCATSCRR